MEVNSFQNTLPFTKQKLLILIQNKYDSKRQHNLKKINTMKKTILLFSFFGAGIIISNAQITITQADVAGVGKFLLQAKDTIKTFTPGSINPGTAGANQTWNFSTLLSDTVDTLTFTNPAWTAQGSNFPNANLAVINSSDGSITYVEKTATGLFADGAYTNPMGQGFMAVTINPKEELISFANTYNSSFKDTSKLSIKVANSQIAGVDSLMMKEVKYKDIKTDGWGHVITPLGNYTSLRQRGPVTTIDSIFAHPINSTVWIHVGAPYSPTVSTVWHFSWWANGVGFPLVEFDSTAADTIRNITWLKTLPVIGGINEASLLSTVNSYPNPSAGQFVVYGLPSTVYSLNIYNVVGECVFQTTSNRKEETINLDVPNGIYFIHIRSKEGIATRKLIISK